MSPYVETRLRIVGSISLGSTANAPGFGFQSMMIAWNW
jgi:hypothetical protein